MLFTAQTKVLNDVFKRIQTVAVDGDSLTVRYDAERDAITFFLRNAKETGYGQTIKTFLRAGADVSAPDKDGSFTIPFDVAAAALYACRLDGVATFNKTAKGRVEIASENSSTRVNETKETSEPEVKKPVWTATIPSGELAEAFMFCAPLGAENSHYALEGVILNFDEAQNCLCAFGTDGRCVGKHSFKGIVPNGVASSKTIPLNNAKRAASICSSVLGDCEVEVSDSFLTLKTSEFEYTTQLLEGRVPNLNAIVYETQMGAFRMECNAKGLLDLTRTLRKVCRKPSKDAYVKFAFGALEMASESEELSWRSKIPLDCVEEEANVILASEYLTSLSFMFDSDQDKTAIYFRDAEKAVSFFAGNKILVVMPLVKNATPSP